jgi:hypothetical protein
MYMIYFWVGKIVPGKYNIIWLTVVVHVFRSKLAFDVISFYLIFLFLEIQVRMKQCSLNGLIRVKQVII